MANRFQRYALDGGDSGVWGPFEIDVDKLALGSITSYLYSNAGVPTLSLGRIGIDDGSQAGAIIVDTLVALSLAGLTASCWARIEASRSGTTPAFAITSIAGETNPAALPASFTGAYDGAKMGYYISATKRVIGLVFVLAAGTLGGIVNCLVGADFDGYSTSDDVDAYTYQFRQFKARLTYPDQGNTWTLPKTAAFTAYARAQTNIYPVTTAANSFNVTVPAANLWAGKDIIIPKMDTGAGIATVIRTGGDTFGGTATAFPLRKQGDIIHLLSDGTNIIVIDSLSTTPDTAALAVSTKYTLAHGLGIRPRIVHSFIVCTSAELNYSVNDEVPLMIMQNSSDHRAASQVYDATNIILLTDSAALAVGDKTTAAASPITMNKWVFRARYKI